MPTCLAFDAGSPVTSAAVARDGALLAWSSGEGRSGPSLLYHIDASLRRAGVALAELDGILALSGPGSFTGIRVALATAQGFRATLAVPVTTISNLAALALPALGSDELRTHRVLALVDALRDEWFAQEFRLERGEIAALGDPQRVPSATLAPAPGAALAAHDGQPLPPHLATIPVQRSGPLACAAALAASAETLGGLPRADLRPLYLRTFIPRNPPG